MRHSAANFFATMLIVLVYCTPLHAQDESDKINANLGGSMTVPVSSQFTSIGWGTVAGAGYNFSEHHSIVGEFMFNRLYLTDQSIQAASAVDGHTDVYSITGNYRYELRGKTFGTYFIGGGGWYYRTTSFNMPLSTTSALATSNSSAFGGNGGIGFTVKVGEPSYRFYVEARYHYAPHKNATTEFVPITVGIRY